MNLLAKLKEFRGLYFKIKVFNDWWNWFERLSDELSMTRLQSFGFSNSSIFPDLMTSTTGRSTFKDFNDLLKLTQRLDETQGLDALSKTLYKKILIASATCSLWNSMTWWTRAVLSLVELIVVINLQLDSEFSQRLVASTIRNLESLKAVSGS